MATLIKLFYIEKQRKKSALAATHLETMSFSSPTLQS